MNQSELADNPFLVLAVAPSASRMEVERAGQKLLAQLAIGVTSVKTYETPFGRAERDESKVRTALASLRDPEERALSELWLSEAGSESQDAGPTVELPAWRNALRSIGWRGPCTG